MKVNSFPVINLHNTQGEIDYASSSSLNMLAPTF